MVRPGAAYSRPSHAAELLLSADGRFLYLSNRGHDSLAGFAIDPSSGILNPVPAAPPDAATGFPSRPGEEGGGDRGQQHWVDSGGRIPWAFALFGGEVDEWLAVQNNSTRAEDTKNQLENVALFKRCVETGVLRDTRVRLEFQTVSAIWHTCRL
eukprot:COSAG05_NODE_2567_length_2889_cov_1.497491_4_plen_154_part_00